MQEIGSPPTVATPTYLETAGMSFVGTLDLASGVWVPIPFDTIIGGHIDGWEDVINGHIDINSNGMYHICCEVRFTQRSLTSEVQFWVRVGGVNIAPAYFDMRTAVVGQRAMVTSVKLNVCAVARGLNIQNIDVIAMGTGYAGGVSYVNDAQLFMHRIR